MSQMPSSDRRFLSAAMLALVGMVLAFTVPYLFPPAVRTLSASYDYGFNNRVGILLLGLAAIACGGVAFFRSASVTTSNDVTAFITRRDVLWAVLPSLLVVALVSAFSGSYGFGESTQFISAMERLATGQRLYTDFDFYYGPLLAYAPYALSQLLHFSATDFRTGYFVVLAVLQIVGLLELRYVLGALDIDGKARRRMFFAIALSTLPFHSGINLILFRFITPAAGLLLLYRLGRAGVAARCAAVLALSFLTFGISVEYGVVFTVAAFVHLVCARLFERSSGDLPALATVVLAPMLFYAAFPGLFYTVGLYLQGAWQWPFVPSLALILFMAALMTLAYSIGARLRDVRRHHFLLTLALLALASLPAALGRCDPGHLILNGLMILVLAYAGLAARRSAGVFGVAFVLAFGVLYNVSTIRSYSSIYLSSAFRKLNADISPSRMDGLIDAGARFTGLSRDAIVVKIAKFNSQQAVNPAQAFRSMDRIAAPYAPPEPIATYLRTSGKLEFLYFKDYSILASDQEVNRALDDLRRRDPPFLLLPADWAELADVQDQGPLIDQLFSTRYPREAMRNSRALLAPLVAFIRSRYVEGGHVGNFVALRRTGLP